MSRVNLIPVEELFDQHLMAEFREISHIGKALQRSLKRKKPFTKTEIPKVYTLNEGHVKFFYDKGKFLDNRFTEIKKELLKRGYNINKDKDFNREDFPREFYNDWQPTEQEIEINKERIDLRISQKPKFYRKTQYE